MDALEKKIIKQTVISLEQLLRGKIAEPIQYENYPDTLASLAECINELISSFESCIND